MNINREDIESIKDVITFDKEKFIKRLEKIKDYFISSVKIVNKIKLEEVETGYKFVMDTPSLDFEFFIGADRDSNGREYYYLKEFWEFPFEVSYLDLTREEYEKTDICRVWYFSTR